MISLFITLATQWRHAGLTGVRVGLDYAAVAPTALLLGVAIDADRFQSLRIMEDEALSVWSRKR